MTSHKVAHLPNTSSEARKGGSPEEYAFAMKQERHLMMTTSTQSTVIMRLPLAKMPAQSL